MLGLWATLTNAVFVYLYFYICMSYIVFEVLAINSEYHFRHPSIKGFPNIIVYYNISISSRLYVRLTITISGGILHPCCLLLLQVNKTCFLFSSVERTPIHPFKGTQQELHTSQPEIIEKIASEPQESIKLVTKIFFFCYELYLKHPHLIINIWRQNNFYEST